MQTDNNNKLENKPFNWHILFIISLISIIMGVYRDGFAAFFPFIQSEFNLTRGEIGIYVTFLYFSSSIVSVFIGRLVDLIGAKMSMASGTLLVGILLLLHSISPNFISLLILATVAGLGVSINAPAANKGINESFSQKWRSTATGIWSTAFPVGGLLAASFLPYLGVLFGWRKAVIFPGILAILCTFLIIIFYKNETNSRKRITKTDTELFLKGLFQLFSNIDLLTISIYGFFWGAVSGAITTHFTLFLFLDYKLSASLAGFGFALVQVGSIVSRPGWGIISDRILNNNKRKAFLIMGFLFFVLTIILGTFLKNMNPPISVIFLLSFLVGCTGRGWNGIFFSAVPEMVKKEEVGGAIGLSLLFPRIGLFLSPPIFGYIADVKGAYESSWFFLGLLMFLASVGQYYFYMKNKKVKND
jgi:MFS family permease